MLGADLLDEEAVAAAVPDRPCQINGDRVITWGEFDQRANALAADFVAAARDMPALPRAALAAALEEDPVGDPALCSGDPLTSSTAIHHLFHLERLRAATGVRVGDARVIVEWGGGFGGFARTVRRTATGAPPAHVIIDLPLVSALQWTYLSTVFGEDHVDLALSAGHVPAPGRITLVPSHLAFDLDLRADVFVSLWGLSETSADTQDDVAASGFYGARHLLLAFQDDGPDTPDASRIGALGQAAGGRVEPVGVLANSAYVFA